jgi:protein-S-isoprenylcysteine O-methyltransferase Ste14
LTRAWVAYQNAMMQRPKPIVIALVCGAIAGVLVKRIDLRRFADIPFFAKDHALLSHPVLFYACLGCWVAFSLYWDIAAKNSSPAKSSEAKSSRGVHVFLTNAALLLIAAPIHGLGRFVSASSALMMVGLVIELAGLSIAIWARRHLGRNWSGEITIKQDHQLIRTGPYRYLRHPIYTGILTMFVGLTLATGEWLGLIGLAVAVIAYWRKTRMEEATLNAAFGAEYDAYRRDTWAVVPGVF